VQPGLGNDENYRGYHWLHVFGRLRDGVSIAQAEASLSALYNGIINDVEVALWSSSDDMLEQFRNSSMYLEPGALGQSARRDGMRRPLAMLFGLTLLVLLIVCANVAGLSLARGATREEEIAVRMSIGATRWRLLQQLLTEMSVLAAFGGLLSLPVAAMTIRTLASLLPPNQSGFITSGINTTAGLFAVVATMVTMLIFGLVPALRRSRSDVAMALRGTTSRLSSGKERLVLWKSMATAQVALAVVLLVLSGLFLQSIRNIARVDIGMEIDSVVTFSVFPSLNGYSQDQIADFYRRLDEGLSAEPGIVSVSSALVPLLSSSRFVRRLSMEGEEPGSGQDSFTDYNTVSVDFFSTFSLPIIAGRGFTVGDVERSAQVAIVNESFVRKYGLEDSIGHRFGINGGEGTPEPTIEIVGVVPDAKYSEVKDEAPAQYYLPLGADSWPGFLRYYVQSGIQPDTAMRSIREVAARVDANVPVRDLQTLTETVNQNLFEDRTITTVATSFAVIAVILAAFGLHGVITYSMSQRTRELGLRLALGSTAAGLRMLVLYQVGVIALIGGAVGVFAAVGLGQIAQSMLFGVSGFSLPAAAAAVIGLGIVVVAAGYLPAHRVMRIDPMNALRES
jgi:predicted permease